MLKQMSGKTFSNLLDYYIACLEQEDMLSVTFHVSSEGTAFLSTLFQTETLFHTNNKQIQVKNSEDVKKFFQTSLLQQKNKTLFYGYPVVIGPEGTISPLFYTELQYEQNENEIVFTNVLSQLRLNHYILLQNNFSAEEIVNIQTEIEGEGFLSTLKSICEMLHFSDTDCTQTLDEKLIKRTIAPKLLNKAILYFGEQTGIIHNLIVELNQLKKKPIDEIASTSLLLFLTGEYSFIRTIKENKPLLEVFPLNPAQEEAIHHSLLNSLTVITGPPGTGKSQVVLNIIANAVYQNKTVLFASKNNKAVDVVIDKFNTILTYKLLVRMGHQAYRRKARSELENLVKQQIQKVTSNKITPNNLLAIESQIISVQNQLNKLISLNQSIENIQQILDTLDEQCPKNLSIAHYHSQIDNIDPIILHEDLNKFFGKQGLRQRIQPKRQKQKQEQCFKKHYEDLPPSLKVTLQNLISNKKSTLENVLQWILALKRRELALNEICKIKETLLTIPPYNKVKGSLTDLHRDYIIVSRSLLEQHWLNNLTAINEEDKQCIATYFSASEQLESGRTTQIEFRQLLSQQFRSFQKILRFLPVWVVTNLSAKQSFPLKNNLFDILIIDEASQCDIVSALPLFFRAKHIVIIGDPNQLNHISLLTQTQDRNLANIYHISDELFADLSYVTHSLYDIAARIVQEHHEQPLLLNEHYRCHPDIVSFSNEYYYGRKLTIATEDTRLLHHPSLDTRIIWHHVKGKTIHTKSPYNEEEAERVVEEILRIIEMASSLTASIGVVTLFRAQTEIITEKLRKFQDFFNIDITIGTAHRFQGDEKDIIIFSPAVSEGVKAGTLQWIQTTNQLLNVAVTRARSLFIIVGDQEVCRQTTGPLKNLSDYVETRKITNTSFDSSIKLELYEELKQQGIPLIPNYPIKGAIPLFIDFVLFVNGNKYAIEIRDEETRIDKKQLRREGWKIRRFLEKDLHLNRSQVIDEIKRLC